jgi:LPS-assembly protein
MPTNAFPYQFRLHPLAAAVLMLSVSTLQQLQAAPTDQNTTTGSAQNTSTPAAGQQTAETSRFFNEYFVDREQMQQVPIDQRRHIPATCRGTWVTPINAVSAGNNVPADQATTVITADEGYYDQEGGSSLSGNVQIDQPGRSVRADKIALDKTQTIADAKGNVRIADAGMVSMSDSAVYNLQNQSGKTSQTAFISESQKAHGQAGSIDRDGKGITTLYNSTYSTCEPEAKLPWQLRSREIELNENTGRGITRHSRLYIKDVPVISIPYFNFPIDDRRTSGFLVPTMGYTNDGGVQLSVPYYFNLAPNYDLTLTPRYLNRRGLMVHGDFRFLTEDFGEGEFRGGYLPSDGLFDNNDRKQASFLYNWQLTDSLRSVVDYNYVSDKDYFSDLGTDPSSKNILNQERTWTLYYENGIPGLTGLFRTQSFQTVDKTTPDVDKPYARLPQLLLNYRGGSPFGLQYNASNDTAYFKKDIGDGSALENSGTRIYNRFATSYNFRNQWGYATPELSLRTVNTFFDQDTINSQNLTASDDRQRAAVVPQFSFDSAAVFERDGNFLQSITPRFFYAYAPYKKQSNYPNFDTTTASLNYDQLFNPYRFYGHDRLDDNNFASLGVTYRAYDPLGLERLRFSVGESYYFDDRKVRLNETDPIGTSTTSGPAVTVGSQLSKSFFINSNAMWTSGGDLSENDFYLNYIGNTGNLYNAGYYYRRAIAQQNQQAYKQVSASFIQPIYNQWRLMGYMQYDLDRSLAREWLLGFNYDACCWRVSLYGRSYYNDLDDPKAPGIKPKRAIMAEITLKGLAGFSGNLGSLLQQKITGYKQVETSWNDR